MSLNAAPSSGNVPATPPPPLATPDASKVLPFLKKNNNKVVLASTGLKSLLFPYSIAPLVWAGQALQLGLLFLSRPFLFFAKDANRGKKQLPALDDLQRLGLEGLMQEDLYVNGTRLHAVSFGRHPGKPLLLFLHGFPEGWYSWRHQLALLRNDYEVVALDMRGYGASDKPKGMTQYTVPTLCADVAAAVRALGRQSATLVSHDWGGGIAWTVAAVYPQIVERLVVLAAPPLPLFLANMTFAQSLRSWYFLLFLAPILPNLLFLNTDAELMGKLFTPRATAGSPTTPGCMDERDAEVFKQAAQRPGAMDAALNYYRALMLYDMGVPGFGWPKGFAELICQPLDASLDVLVLWGEKDHALGLELTTHLDKYAPGATLHVVKGSSHWVQQDKVEEANRVIKDWLATHPPRTSVAVAKL